MSALAHNGFRKVFSEVTEEGRTGSFYQRLLLLLQPEGRLLLARLVPCSFICVSVFDVVRVQADGLRCCLGGGAERDSQGPSEGCCGVAGICIFLQWSANVKAMKATFRADVLSSLQSFTFLTAHHYLPFIN